MWAARITDPRRGPHKTYHVQIDRLPSAALLRGLAVGIEHNGERLAAASTRCLRAGRTHAWLQIVLQEGHNRQIRRLLADFEVSVLRLVRVAIGSLPLGELPKGHWRILSPQETDAL
jgi:23S rRNA pseudouridine2605 synthase